MINNQFSNSHFGIFYKNQLPRALARGFGQKNNWALAQHSAMFG